MGIPISGKDSLLYWDGALLSQDAAGPEDVLEPQEQPLDDGSDAEDAAPEVEPEDVEMEDAEAPAAADAPAPPPVQQPPAAAPAANGGLAAGLGLGAPGAGLAAAHQAMLQGAGPTGVQPYREPHLFPFKVNTE